MLRYIYIYIYIAKVDDSRYSWGWGNKTKKITSIWVKEKAYSNKQYNVYIYIIYYILYNNINNIYYYYYYYYYYGKQYLNNNDIQIETLSLSLFIYLDISIEMIKTSCC